MSSAAQVGGEQPAKHPAQLGPYTVVREIGKGGMARVFEGRHAELGIRVALKLVLPAIASHPVATARFLREAKAASQIRHQNVVEVFDIGTHEDMPFIVMEFLEGSDLATLLVQRGVLPIGGLADVFLPIVSAVATAHRVGVIHRDLKPANVVLSNRPPLGVQPVILDFGISKILDDDDNSTLTRSESLLGTVPYMAPELTKGAKFACPATDQYAVGAMLYECATGQRPFQGDSYYDLMHAIVTEPITPPSELDPSLPPEFDELVLRALARDPDKRFPSVHALGRALLPLANKSAWAIWEREFLGEPDGPRHPWGDGTGTLMDDGTPKPLVVTKRNPTLRARKPTRWLVGALAAYAVIATFLLTRRTPKPEATAAASSTSVPHTEPPRAVETPAPSKSATAITAIETVGAPAVHDFPAEASDRRAASKARGPSPSKVTPPKTASPQSAASAPAPAGVLGTNGALIFE
jgi:serine/threonine-protein kinase